MRISNPIKLNDLKEETHKYPHLGIQLKEWDL